MMKLFTLAGCVALPLAMAACASFPSTTGYLTELEATKPTGSPFTQALSQEYLALAKAEKDQVDYLNSQLFAHKGLDAAKGTAVPPETLNRWSIDNDASAAALIAGRERLMAVLATSAPQRLPALTATAQVKYDCWVAQTELNLKTSQCRNDFTAAVDAIESQGKAPAAAQAAKAEAAQRHQLFFEFNKSALTVDAAKAAVELAKAAKAAGYPAIKLAGYTDSSGSASYNMALSLRRAQAVKKALIAVGVPADRITVEGRGKESPLVATADGVKEPQNRRVEAVFAK